MIFSMGRQTKDKVFFTDSMEDYDVVSLLNEVVHILCLEGSMSFTFRETRYNTTRGDYAILTNASLASGFTRSEDFKGLLRPARFLLDRPFYPPENSPAALPERTYPDRNCRAHELFIGLVFQPVCAKTDRTVPHRIQEPPAERQRYGQQALTPYSIGTNKMRCSFRMSFLLSPTPSRR